MVSWKIARLKEEEVDSPAAEATEAAMITDFMVDAQ